MLLLVLAVVRLFRETQVKWSIAGLITESHVIHMIAFLSSAMFVAAMLSSAPLSLMRKNIKFKGGHRLRLDEQMSIPASSSLDYRVYCAN